jgi:hypothetical protein
MRPEDVRAGRVYKGGGAIQYRRVVEFFCQNGVDQLLWVAPAEFPGRDRLNPSAPLQGRVTSLQAFVKWAEREVGETELTKNGDAA